MNNRLYDHTDLVVSHRFYPQEYSIRPIEDQIKDLAQAFGLSGEKAYNYAKNLGPCPVDWTEGLFAVLSPRALFPEIVDPQVQYCEALKIMFAAIKNQHRNFYNNLEGRIDPQHIRMPNTTINAVRVLIEMQDNSDILVVDAQMGQKYAGSSSRRSREILDSGEYGLPILFGGSMVLNHQQRCVREGELDFSCIGDDISIVGDVFEGVFLHTPFFFFDKSKLQFGSCWAVTPSTRLGSASFFLRS